MNSDEGDLRVLFKNTQYLWLYVSNLAFFFAMQSQIVMRSWLAFKLTDSEFALGLVAFSTALPMFFLSPFGGMMSDRIDRRNLILYGQCAAFMADLVVVVLILTDNIQFWHLLFSSGVNGCIFPLIMPARTAIVVNIVGKQRLEKAMALNMGGMNTARVIGPAMAGFLIDLIGIRYAYLFGASLLGLGVVSMFPINRSNPVALANQLPPLKSIWEGALFIKDNRLVMVLLLFGLIPMFLAAPFQNLLVVFAEKVWNVGPRGFGLLSSAMGMGGILGAIWIAFLKSSHRRLFRMMVCVILFCVLLFCFSFSPWFWGGLIMVFCANVFVNMFQTFNNTNIQLLIPDSVRGRVSSFLMMSFSLPLLGTLPISAVAELYGAPIALGMSAILAIIIAVVFYWISSNLRNMDKLVLVARGKE
ncbi:MAG: MFS transporter [Desulfatitalea sp.]|nr:MFS transporter [Desulfatitalea sp.]NNK00307.1 MFS transporter [Desulfatitalea sp.]